METDAGNKLKALADPDNWDYIVITAVSIVEAGRVAREREEIGFERLGTPLFDGDLRGSGEAVGCGLHLILMRRWKYVTSKGTVPPDEGIES